MILTNNNPIAMNTKKQKDDFQTVWVQRKQHWQEQAEETLPDDDTLLRLAEMARQRASQQAAVVVPLTHRRRRWMPYAAAACIFIGVSAIALNHKTSSPLPKAEEVTVEGQTVHFLCNNGCSAQDVIVAVNEVIKK